MILMTPSFYQKVLAEVVAVRATGNNGLAA